MKTKRLTNRQVFRKVVSEMDDPTLAILRERILLITDMTFSDEVEVRKKMEGSFFSADLFFDAMKKIKDAFEFKEVTA